MQIDLPSPLCSCMAVLKRSCRDAFSSMKDRGEFLALARLKEPYAANTKVAIAGMRSSAPASTKKKRSELRGFEARLTQLGIAAHMKGHTA